MDASFGYICRCSTDASLHELIESALLLKRFLRRRLRYKVCSLLARSKRTCKKENELSLIFIIYMYTFYTACREQQIFAWLHIYVQFFHSMLSYKLPMSHEISAERTSTTLVLTTKQNCHSLSSPPSYHIIKEQGYYEDESAQRHHCCYQLPKYKRLHNFFDSKGGRYVVLHYMEFARGCTQRWWWICSFFQERKIQRILTHTYLPLQRERHYHKTVSNIYDV